MTDENTTWVVQNQQTSSIKSWDYFVLDFWEWENLQVIDDNNELKNQLYNKVVLGTMYIIYDYIKNNKLYNV